MRVQGPISHPISIVFSLKVLQYFCLIFPRHFLQNVYGSIFEREASFGSERQSGMESVANLSEACKHFGASLLLHSSSSSRPINSSRSLSPSFPVGLFGLFGLVVCMARKRGPTTIVSLSCTRKGKNDRLFYKAKKVFFFKNSFPIPVLFGEGFSGLFWRD